ncbi:MAG: ABC transporter permease subunit [Eubacteriales bacterium]|nr:ABC transporter permease subunit [Eubacteriales bacterium]
MNVLRQLYPYELKKLLQTKVLWIGTLIMVALCILINFAQTAENSRGLANIKQQNEAARALSGRPVDEQLLTEMKDNLAEDQTEINPNDPYFEVEQFVWFTTMSAKSFRTIDEDSLYQARLAKVKSNRNDMSLTENEEVFWSEKENQISTPITYTYSKGYRGFIMNIYASNYILIILIGLCLSAVFADEYEKKTDQLLLCTRFGKQKLFYAKLLAGLTVGIVQTILMLGIPLAINFAFFGTDGFDAAIQTLLPECSLSLSLGNAFLITLGVAFIIGILYSVFSMFLSVVFKARAVVIGVMVLQLFSSQINLPSAFRGLSDAWNYLPGTFLGGWMFTECRLVPILGHYLTAYQAAPIIYLVVGILLFVFARRAYRNWQITGR